MQKQIIYQQLQPEDRITLATMRQRGFSVRAIARTLERAPSTIARELARNANAGQDYGSHQNSSNCHETDNPARKPVLVFSKLLR